MQTKWIRWVAGIIMMTACHSELRIPDGRPIEIKILSENNLVKDFTNDALFRSVIVDINCTDSAVINKRLVLAKEYYSADTNEILLIPFISNGKTFKSSAYSDIQNRFILINPEYIRQFSLKNTLNDTNSYKPVLELMLLHEIGHFILHQSGSFDVINNTAAGQTGQVIDNTQPELLNPDKRVELSADSLAVDLVKRSLYPGNRDCLNIAFDVELIIPGMQFQLSGLRMIENFGSRDIAFLHDPSKDHPNLELRITFMNYFLNPNDSLKAIIEDYIYNRTVAPVHRQEMDPRIFQGQEKKL